MKYSEERKAAIKQGVWKRIHKNSIIKYVNGIEDAERLKVLMALVFELYMVDQKQREGAKENA